MTKTGLAHVGASRLRRDFAPLPFAKPAGAYFFSMILAPPA
jgi:hypothetical protein